MANRNVEPTGPDVDEYGQHLIPVEVERARQLYRVDDGWMVYGFEVDRATQRVVRDSGIGLVGHPIDKVLNYLLNGKNPVKEVLRWP